MMHNQIRANRRLRLPFKSPQPEAANLRPRSHNQQPQHLPRHRSRRLPLRRAECFFARELTLS